MPYAIKKADPVYTDVHVDAILTQISVAYMQSVREYRAADIFPIVPVAKFSDKYFKYRKEDWFRAAAARRAPSTESAGGGYVLTTDSYSADLWSWHKDVDDFVRQNADTPLDPDREAAELVTRVLLLTREKEWINTFFTTGVWTGQPDQTGVDASPGANQFLRWNNANSTPVADIRKAKVAIKKTTGYAPNVLVLQEEVFWAVRDHPDFIDRVKYTQRALPADLDSADLMAAFFGVDRVVVLGAVEATGAEGAATMGFAAGKHALLCYAAPRPGLMQPSAGYIFSPRLQGVAGAGNVSIDRIRMPALRSDRIEGNMAWAMKDR
ncbi:MAG: major capsid protein, partial [Candidatus Aenigmatarchaeota archaeon]